METKQISARRPVPYYTAPQKNASPLHHHPGQVPPAAQTVAVNAGTATFPQNSRASGAGLRTPRTRKEGASGPRSPPFAQPEPGQSGRARLVTPARGGPCPRGGPSAPGAGDTAGPAGGGGTPGCARAGVGLGRARGAPRAAEVGPQPPAATPPQRPCSPSSAVRAGASPRGTPEEGALSAAAPRSASPQDPDVSGRQRSLPQGAPGPPAP